MFHQHGHSRVVIHYLHWPHLLVSWYWSSCCIYQLIDGLLISGLPMGCLLVFRSGCGSFLFQKRQGGYRDPEVAQGRAGNIKKEITVRLRLGDVDYRESVSIHGRFCPEPTWVKSNTGIIVRCGSWAIWEGHVGISNQEKLLVHGKPCDHCCLCLFVTRETLWSMKVWRHLWSKDYWWTNSRGRLIGLYPVNSRLVWATGALAVGGIYGYVPTWRCVGYLFCIICGGFVVT